MRKKKLVLIFLVIFLTSGNLFAQSGWQKIFFSNSSGISKIVKRDSLNYFGFCNNSQYFFKSTNAGENWISQQDFKFDKVYSISDGIFVNSNTGWAVGNFDVYPFPVSGVILRTTDGGFNWIVQNTGIPSFRFHNVSFINQNTGWVSSDGGYYSSLIKTTNGGASWDSVTTPGAIPNNPEIDAAKFLNADFGWILSFYGYLYKTSNGGQSWVNDTTFKYLYLFDVTPVTENECWVVARDGAPNSRFYKTTNGGLNWALKMTNASSYTKINFINSFTGYSCGNGRILRTQNGGDDWDTLFPSQTPFSIQTIFTSDGITMLSAGEGSGPSNKFFKSTNSGANWAITSATSTITFNDIYFKDKKNGIAVGDTGSIYKSLDSGKTWSITGGTSGLSKIFFADDNTGFSISTFSSVIFKTTNFGESWFNSGYPVTSTGFHTVDFVNSQTGFIGGVDKKIIKTTNAGINWINVSPAGSIFYTYRFIDFINENTGWAIGDITYNLIHGGYYRVTQIIKTTNQGENWSQIYSYQDETTPNVIYDKIQFFNNTKGWIISDNAIKQTTDGGLSWSNFQTIDGAKTLKMLDENTGWAGGANGNGAASIFKTTNGGINWYRQYFENGRGINSICILNSDYVWACGNLSGIYRTTDGGGKISSITPISNNSPDNFSLHQNYPNPFNPSTVIRYQLSAAGFTTLKVFDLLGKEVASLVNEKQNAGSYAVDFNSSDFNLPSGIYFYTLNVGEFKETKKMVLVK